MNTSTISPQIGLDYHDNRAAAEGDAVRRLDGLRPHPRGRHFIEVGMPTPVLIKPTIRLGARKRLVAVMRRAA